jgi:hypothetical protein
MDRGYATATEDTATEHMEYTEYGPVPRIARALARLIPAVDREAILGDLLEEAAFRDLRGSRRSAWLAGECTTIVAGLSVERARGWIVMPPVREVAAGFAVDGRCLLRHGTGAAILRALAFAGCVATLVLGVELLVATLMSAAGF